jgi:hypothetical protein
MKSMCKACVCIAAIGVCLASCAGTPVSHYHLAIDTGVPEKYAQAEYAAINDWMQILDGKLQIDISPPGCVIDDFEICVRASSHADIVKMGGSDGNIGFTKWFPFSQNAIIYVPVEEDENDTPALLQQVAMHEVGHAMQLFHLKVGVMCWDVGCATPTVSCHDAAYWHYLRGDYQWSEWQGNKSCPPTSFTLSGS